MRPGGRRAGRDGVRRRGAGIALAAWIALGAAAAAEPGPAPGPGARIDVSVSPTRPEVGLVMAVSVTIQGAEGADCDLLEVPEVDGARMERLAGPSVERSFSNINGRINESIVTRWDFELIPERAGPLDLPPFRFNCRGDEATSEWRNLQVGTSPLRDDVVDLRVTPSATTLYEGQVVTMDVELAILEAAYEARARTRRSANGLDIVLPWIEGVRGLHLLDPVPEPCSRDALPVSPGPVPIPYCIERESFRDAPRLVFSLRIPLLATEAGVLRLPDARFSARLVTERQRRRDPFDVFGLLDRSVASRVVVADAIAEGATIEVRPAPDEGRPAAFTGAVGRFRLSGDASPRAIAVGESVSVTLELALADPTVSPGVLDLVEWPDYSAVLGDFRTFGKEDRSERGRRELTLEISPKHERVETVPRLEFAFFDPVAGRYETAGVGPFGLDVSGGGDEGLVELSTPEEMLSDLETIRETLPPPAEPGLPPWIAPLAGAVLAAAVEIGSRRRSWRRRHGARLARRGARRELERALQRCDDVPAVAAAFARYLSARLEGPPGGMTAEEAAERCGDEGLAARLREVVSGWEAAYLGGASLDPATAAAQARELAAEVEAAT